MSNKLPNIHPGEILLEEFLEPMELSKEELAQKLKVPTRIINEIVSSKRSITVDMAIRLGKYFGIGAAWWLNLQNFYDLEEAARKTEKSSYSDIPLYKRAG